MLPKHAWREFEPRFGFPTFKGVRSLASFSIRPDFRPLDYARIAAGAKAALRQGPRAVKGFATTHVPLLLHCRGKRLRFRVIVTTRGGEFLGEHRVQGVYPPGGAVDVDVSGLIERMGLPDDDYMAIMVMSNGRHDAVRSSPGSYSMTYYSDRFYTTYRTGGFVRTLNDPRRKSHFGFRGINPKAVATGKQMSSLLLINHSSSPAYDRTVAPTALLLRPDGQTREAGFGEIPPFGGVERSLEDLFGADVVEFLAPFGGQATTITTCPGVTLASLHLMRARDGSSMSIEHSRPTHTYLINPV